LFTVGGLLVVLGLAFFVSPLASSSPDGLEKVSQDQGFANSAEDHTLGDSPLADYGVEGVEDEGLSTGLSGIIGVVMTFGAAMVVFGLIRVQAAKRRRGEGPIATAGRVPTPTRSTSTATAVSITSRPSASSRPSCCSCSSSSRPRARPCGRSRPTR